jgi:polysaccharide export outer membrane protein
MVQANDVIYVPLAGSYFVDGMVRNPGAYHLTEPVTLSRAIAMAGGMVGGADIKKVGIYRTTKGGSRKPIIVNLEEIRTGKMADPAIQEGDVILVGKDRLQVLVSKFLGFFGVHYNMYPYRFGVGQ